MHKCSWLEAFVLGWLGWHPLLLILFLLVSFFFHTQTNVFTPLFYVFKSFRKHKKKEKKCWIIIKTPARNVPRWKSTGNNAASLLNIYDSTLQDVGFIPVSFAYDFHLFILDINVLTCCNLSGMMKKNWRVRQRKKDLFHNDA